MRRFLLNLKSVRLVVAPLIVTALGLAVISSCAPALSTPAATPAAATRATPTALATATAQAKVEEIARDIVSNVGEVSSVRQGDPRRVIFVFTENHASRLGQIEIAVMLNRLYLHYGLRHIGLEGVMAADSPLDASWFRPLSPPQLASGAKQEVAVKLLSQGEISSAELMTLVYPEIVVHGIEKADEYPLGLSDAASGSPLFYLLAIAEKSMLPPQKAEAQKLCNEAEQAPDSEKPQKIQDCIDYVMGTNEWTK